MKVKIIYVISAFLILIVSGCSKPPKYNFESKEALMDSVLIQAGKEGIDLYTVAMVMSYPEINEMENKATAKLIEEKGRIPNNIQESITFTKEARKRCEPEQLKFYESKMRGKTLKQLIQERGIE